MNTLPKYVASQTLTEPLPWNGELIKGDVAEAVTKLKEQPGEQILIYGSAQLVNALLARDVIDRYRLMVFPITVGTGERLFTDASLKAFNLAEAKTTSTGVAMLTYDFARS